MASRNLTKLFLRQRKEFHTTIRRQREEPKQESLPQWVSILQVMKDKRFEIQTKINELEAMQQKRFKVQFSTLADDDAMEKRREEEIEDKTQEIISLFQKEDQLLRSLQPMDTMTIEEKKIHQNLWLANYQQLQSLQRQFRSTQKTYMKKLSSTSKLSPVEIMLSEMKEKEKDQSSRRTSQKFVDNGFSDEQGSQVQQITQLIDDRDEEIQRIAKSIQELALLFKDLAVTVHYQGTILDRIDYNLDNAVELVKSGTKEIVTAEDHQKKASCAKVIIGLELAVAAVTGVLIWKMVRK